MSEEKQSTELENEKIAISPAQHKDDIASLEREAWEKREQVLKQEQEDKSAHPIQPTINKLKKKKKGECHTLSRHYRSGTHFSCMGE